MKFNDRFLSLKNDNPKATPFMAFGSWEGSIFSNVA